ncbi:hypothetical protein GCM10012280_09680 [Wenjunlia tyrosinilytica]|uniref:Sigma-70 family RNA polymerase sigma factor n=2 Tax=Wenjunlia tyrosinilytica TaxID=1544741 RepID=A0A917ZIG8_9ACTN|nr:hypothetical protein GCM10012280_09680 [Wenjunlia tyrosinilytica]
MRGNVDSRAGGGRDCGCGGSACGGERACGGRDRGDPALMRGAALGSAAALDRLHRMLAHEIAHLPPEEPAFAADPGDLEQAVWLRMLEHLADGGSTESPARWLREAVREEAGRTAADRRRTRRLTARHLADRAEARAHDAELRRAVRDAVPRLPGRCPLLLAGLLARPAPTYRELAAELGISQGSIGPLRSRCVECLRRLLANQGCTGARSG